VQQTRLSEGTLDNVFNARRLIGCDNLLAIAEALGGCPEEWRKRWADTADRLDALTRATSGATPPEPPLNITTSQIPGTTPSLQTAGAATPTPGSALARTAEPGAPAAPDPRTADQPPVTPATVDSLNPARRNWPTWVRFGAGTLAVVATLAVMALVVVAVADRLRGPQPQCATVIKKPSSPLYLEIGKPALRQKRYGEQVGLYLALKPENTPQGTYRAVIVHVGQTTTYGWMLDRDLAPAACTPR
jgi:hypothetical protein